jgi:hydroxymethylpyrimidine/phosphomethylpyrimidine kinase
MTTDENKPGISPPAVVLIISGLDPTGSAGFISDIRVTTAFSLHACGVVTCETVQSSEGLSQIRPSDPALFESQLMTLLDDFTPSAVKIGALASEEIVRIIKRALARIPDAKVVIDPVVAPTKGKPFLDENLLRILAKELIPRATVCTPNVGELSALTEKEINPSDDEAISTAAVKWLDVGTESVLVTGLIRGRQIIDRLFQREPAAAGQIHSTDFPHPLFAVGEVHGSGCVLSASIAAALACGEDTRNAVRRATEFTAEALRCARKIGKGAAFWSLSCPETK